MANAPASRVLLEIQALLRQGEITKAINRCETQLAAAPGDLDLQCLYGFALLAAGRVADAAAPIQKAASGDPSNPQFRSALAELHLTAGDVGQGIKELTSITAAHPRYAPAWSRLGRLHYDRQEFQQASDALDAALQANPSDLATALLLARALVGIREFAGVYHVLDHAEKLDPDNLETLTLRLDIARARRDFGAMETLARKLTEIAPDRPSGWRDLATALFEKGMYIDALAALDRMHMIVEPSAQDWTSYATIAMQALDFRRASTALDKAERIDPENARVKSVRAMLLIYQGDSAGAEKSCLDAIRIDPALLAPYQYLSVVRKGRLDSSEEEFVRSYARREDITKGSRASASFVLAQSLEARDDADAAFEEYQNANRLAADRMAEDQIEFDYHGSIAWTDAIIRAFQGPEDIDYQGPDGATPIFIVGLPRSGSTLVESVISAHSKVDAGGEMPMMPNLFNAWLKENHTAGRANIPAESRLKFAEAYLRGVPADFCKDFVTDKNLLSIEAAGFIAQIFPKAKIINVRREPVECAFSIWRQDMPKFWGFATSLENIALRYGLYAKLVDHFERILPGRFVTVQYEEFAGDFENRAKALIAACGLDWEPQCGAFQKERPVAPTLSALQVREAVTVGARRAERYGAKLDALKRTLASVNVDLKTGALHR